MGYQLIAIAVGGALGALSRFGISMLASNQSQSSFPYGTLVANLAGCAVIGFAFVWLSQLPDSHGIWKGLLITGFLGALTTFSTFSLDLLLLLQSGAIAKGLLYLLLNVVGCLAMVTISFYIGKWVF